jgi:hypothetical protein
VVWLLQVLLLPPLLLLLLQVLVLVLLLLLLVVQGPDQPGTPGLPRLLVPC